MPTINITEWVRQGPHHPLQAIKRVLHEPMFADQLKLSIITEILKAAFPLHFNDYREPPQ